MRKWLCLILALLALISMPTPVNAQESKWDACSRAAGEMRQSMMNKAYEEYQYCLATSGSTVYGFLGCQAAYAAARSTADSASNGFFWSCIGS